MEHRFRVKTVRIIKIVFTTLIIVACKYEKPEHFITVLTRSNAEQENITKPVKFISS